jgi:hypothetical protein
MIIRSVSNMHCDSGQCEVIPTYMPTRTSFIIQLFNKAVLLQLHGSCTRSSMILQTK